MQNRTDWISPGPCCDAVTSAKLRGQLADVIVEGLVVLTVCMTTYLHGTSGTECRHFY